MFDWLREDLRGSGSRAWDWQTRLLLYHARYDHRRGACIALSTTGIRTRSNRMVKTDIPRKKAQNPAQLMHGKRAAACRYQVASQVDLPWLARYSPVILDSTSSECYGEHAIPVGNGADSGAVRVDDGPRDTQLARIVELWPTLNAGPRSSLLVEAESLAGHHNYRKAAGGI